MADEPTPTNRPARDQVRRLLNPADEDLMPVPAVEETEHWLFQELPDRRDSEENPVPGPLAQLSERLFERRRRAVDTVDDSGPVKLMRDLKANLLKAVKPINEELAELEASKQDYVIHTEDGPVVASGYQRRLTELQERRHEAVLEEVERYLEHERKLLSRFGATEPADEPVVSADKVGRVTVALQQAQSLSDEGLGKLVMKHADRNHRDVLQALQPIVEDRIAEATGGRVVNDGSGPRPAPLPPGHPLRDAQRAIELGQVTGANFEADAARDTARRMRAQAAMLAREIGNTGDWSGVRARVQVMGRSSTPDFPLVTPEEIEAHGEVA